MEKITYIFYSWQSDLPGDTNRSAIRAALRQACSELEHEYKKEGLRLEPDEATRDESGSVNIPQTIIKKIARADIFVADVSTINSSSPDGRRSPNPNVVFELGYAMGALGWERIVMLFNEHFGKFPSDLPFDFDRHRASPYKIEPAAAGAPAGKQAGQKKLLKDLLVVAIRQILINKPLRPRETEEKSPAELKRQRDIGSLKWILSAIHQPTMQEFLGDIPHRIRQPIFDFWEDFEAVYQNSLFYIYDTAAKKLLDDVYRSWWTTMSFGHRYDMSYHGQSFIFRSNMDMLSEEQQRDWNKSKKAARQLAIALGGLLEHVRNNYLEIDLDEMSANAWRRYVNFHKEMDRMFESKKTGRSKKRAKPPTTR